MSDLEHGKIHTYNRGCRCTPCKAAKNAEQRARYAATKQDTVRDHRTHRRPLGVTLAFVGDWVDQAACATAGLTANHWVPESNRTRKAEPVVRRNARQALAVCAGCPVREQCLEAALSIPREHDWGVLGGTIVHDRMRIRRQRQAVA